MDYAQGDRHPGSSRKEEHMSQQPAYPRPARTAHGLGYWLFVGWWWGPTKWVGRVLLWFFLFPVGIWRSIRHSQKAEGRRWRRASNR